MREGQGCEAISSQAVDVAHGEAGDGDDHSENTTVTRARRITPSTATVARVA